MNKKVITILLAATVLTGTIFHPITEMNVMATPPMISEPEPEPKVIQSGDFGYIEDSYNIIEIVSYNGNGGDIVFPEQIDGKSVMRIGSINSEKITGITIPKTVNYVSPGLFSGCKNFEHLLVDANNPYYVAENDILYDKSKKTLISCPSGKKGEINIPEGVIEIESSAFRCSNLKSIKIPEGVTTLKRGVFVDCSALENIILPDSLTTMEDHIFNGCSSLTSIVIPKGLKSIYGRTFYKCSNLKQIDVDEKNMTYTSVDGILYEKDESGEMVLACCPEGKSGEVKIFEEATRVSLDAFNENCTNITSIKIPKSITDIGFLSYWDDMNLQKIEVDKDNAVYTSEDGILYDKAKTKLLKCPVEKTGRIVIPNSVTCVESSAFENGKLSNVTFPEGLNEIGIAAFRNCQNLTEIAIPSGVTRMESHAFYDCRNLKSITIPSGVKIIETCTFDGCTNLTTITIPKGVEQIGYCAFESCTKLQNVIIPETVVSLDVKAFDGCSALEHIDISENNKHYTCADGILYNKAKTELLRCMPGKSGTVNILESVTSIDSGAFKGCYNLKSIIIPGTVSNLDKSMFSECSSLESITVHETNANYTSIDGVLYNKAKTEVLCCPCGKPGELNIPTGVTTIANTALSNCHILVNINIPETLDNLPLSALSDCDSLKNITVDTNNMKYSSQDGILYDKNKYTLLCCPAGKSGEVNIPKRVYAIGENAFKHCKELTQIAIPKTVRFIGSDAFLLSEKLKDIYYEGNAAEWNEIDISKGNDILKQITIHYDMVMNPELSITFGGQILQGTTKVRVKKSYDLDAVMEFKKNQPENVSVSWKSSNKKIATVTADGVVKVKKKGTVKITATLANGQSKTIKLNAVEKKINVKKISIAGNQTMMPKSSQNLNITVTPATADNQKVTWKSSDKKIATVNKKGKVKAKKKGKVKITAKATDGSKKKATITIKVK